MFGLVNVGKVNIEIIDILGKFIDFYILWLRFNLIIGEKCFENRNDIGYIKYVCMLEIDIESIFEVLILSFNRFMLNIYGNCMIFDIFGDFEEVVECELEVILWLLIGFFEVFFICFVLLFVVWYGYYKYRGI